MPQAIKFNNFVKALAEKKHNLRTDVLKVMLTNTLPSVSAVAKGQITEITPQNGYAAGGPTLVVTAGVESGGVYSLAVNDLTITATGGPVGPFRYAVIYNNTATGEELIAYVDKGAPTTLGAGEAITLDIPANLFVLQ